MAEWGLCWRFSVGESALRLQYNSYDVSTHAPVYIRLSISICLSQSSRVQPIEECWQPSLHPLTNRHPPRNSPHSRHCKTRSTEHIQRVSIFVNISIIFANSHTRSRLFGVRARFNKTTATGDCSSSPKLNCFCPPRRRRDVQEAAAGACMYMLVCTVYLGWWRGTVVERRSLAGELSLSCARPAADG